MAFKVGGIRHWYVLASAVDDRCIEVIEGLLHQNGADVAANGTDGETLFYSHAAVGFLDRLDDRFCVHWAQRAQVDDLGVNAVFGEFVGGFECVFHADAEGHDCDVIPCTGDFGFADWDCEVVHFWNVARCAVKDFVFQNDHRVWIADRGFHQTLIIGGGVRHHDLETRNLRIPRGVVLGVLRANAGRSTVRATENHGGAHLAA